VATALSDKAASHGRAGARRYRLPSALLDSGQTGAGAQWLLTNIGRSVAAMRLCGGRRHPRSTRSAALGAVDGSGALRVVTMPAAAHLRDDARLDPEEIP